MYNKVNVNLYFDNYDGLNPNLHKIIDTTNYFIILKKY